MALKISKNQGLTDVITAANPLQTQHVKNGSVADGKIQIVLDKADTEELSGLFMHECEVTDQSGNVSTVTSGAVNIQADMI